MGRMLDNYVIGTTSLGVAGLAVVLSGVFWQHPYGPYPSQFVRVSYVIRCFIRASSPSPPNAGLIAWSLLV